MMYSIGKRATWLILGGLLSIAGPAMAEDRSADTILAEIKAVKLPDRPGDVNSKPESRNAYTKAVRAAMDKKAELIGELLKASPEHPDLPDLLPIRWQAIRTNADLFPALKAETDAVIAKGENKKLVADAYQSRTMGFIIAAKPETKPDVLLAEFKVFATKYPKNPSLMNLIGMIVSRVEDSAAKLELYKTIEADFPDTPFAKKAASSRIRLEGSLTKLDRVGKPFVLEFTDAIKGSQVSMANLKGKVVVIDFWATWCGPCVAEMPHMKQLYAEFKEKGVEFIGVSLDQPKEAGGLDKLKAFVAKNGIEWPQYYQGNYWDSEFSSSWGINSIPCIFLVDAEGNLASIDAGGKLEKMIPEYLEKAKAKKTVSNP
jgi:thiol-disulfide isomerase/thioredoxin